jgi:hypothetical protein
MSLLFALGFDISLRIITNDFVTGMIMKHKTLYMDKIDCLVLIKVCVQVL